jgi:hypothetical protein
MADLKICKKCRQEKPATLEFFYVSSKGGNVCSPCKSCVSLRAKQWHKNHPQDVRKRKKQWFEKNKDWHRNYDLQRKYGISLKDWLRLHAKQKGACATCLRVTNLHVDHCHTSGRVRGLLCRNCNMALGLVAENVETLLRQAQYLKATTICQTPCAA